MIIVLMHFLIDIASLPKVVWYRLCQCRMLIYTLLFTLLSYQVISTKRTRHTYILSQDCQSPINTDSLLHYSSKKHLQIDNLEETMVIMSHPFATDNQHSNFSSHRYHQSTRFTAINNPKQLNRTSSSYLKYPRGFSCEVVVHTPVENAKIMLRIDIFHVPSATKDCLDNSLNIFDSNTAKSKAMPEAGGEPGLCQSSFPRNPIFSTNSYICLAFLTSLQQPPPNQLTPGFRILITAVKDTKTGDCPPGGFYCGLRRPSYLSRLNHHSSPAGGGIDLYTPAPHGGLQSRLLPSSSNQQHEPLGYCIADRLVCSGQMDCANGADESDALCRRQQQHDGQETWSDWLSSLLALGMPASIGIAVSAIFLFTLCIGLSVYCCHRCGASGGKNRSSRSRPPDHLGSGDQQRVSLMTTGWSPPHTDWTVPQPAVIVDSYCRPSLDGNSVVMPPPPPYKMSPHFNVDDGWANEKSIDQLQLHQSKGTIPASYVDRSLYPSPPGPPPAALLPYQYQQQSLSGLVSSYPVRQANVVTKSIPPISYHLSDPDAIDSSSYCYTSPSLSYHDPRCAVPPASSVTPDSTSQIVDDHQLRLIDHRQANTFTGPLFAGTLHTNTPVEGAGSQVASTGPPRRLYNTRTAVSGRSGASSSPSTAFSRPRTTRNHRRDLSSTSAVDTTSSAASSGSSALLNPRHPIVYPVQL